MSLQGTRSAKHQAAGHPGYLTFEDGTMFVKSTQLQEIEFYTEINKRDSEQPSTGAGNQLSDWLPIYMGTLTEGGFRNVAEIEDNSASTTKYIVLQNLYHGFNRPSILDIKLGSKLTDDSVTAPEKVARLQKVSDETTSGTLNFRVCGMKVFNGTGNGSIPEPIFAGMDTTIITTKDEDSEDTYLEFDKIFGRSLTKETVPYALKLFFSHYLTQQAITSPETARKAVRRLLEVFLKRLQLLYNSLLDYEIRIFSGSLLFIFENDIERWGNIAQTVEDEELYDSLDPLVRDPIITIDEDEEDEEEDEELEKPVVPLSGLNLIDLAHAKFVEGQGYDENIITGIENLIEIFEELIERS